MGYRSHGLWIIKGSVEDITVAWIACRLKIKTPSNDQNMWNEFTTYRRGNEGYIRLAYEGWKWYESYPEIQFCEQIWSELSQNESLSGKRIRIGEDDDDVEQNNFGDEIPDIYACTTISDDEHSDGDPLTSPQETTCSTFFAN